MASVHGFGGKKLVGSVFATIVGMCMLQFIAIIIVQLHIAFHLKLAFFQVFPIPRNPEVYGTYRDYIPTNGGHCTKGIPK